jgi:hypothetical protein
MNPSDDRQWMDRPSLTPELDGVDYYDVARFDWA